MRHRIGTLAVDVEFSLREPWTVLFGPSGSGKSTILRAIAGVVRPQHGRIVLRSDGTAQPHAVRALFDSSSKQWAPAHLRRIPFAPQSASLFPHKTVRENVTCYLGRPGAHAIDEALIAFRIDHVAHKYPAQLSGGEAQRVNLARAAVAAGPESVLLLDEPFTGLDTALRSDLIRALQSWVARRNLCVLSVTHDVAEAFQLGAEVIRIADGKVVAQGPVESVLADERLQLLRQLRSSESSIKSLSESSEPFLSG